MGILMYDERGTGKTPAQKKQIARRIRSRFAPIEGDGSGLPPYPHNNHFARPYPACIDCTRPLPDRKFNKCSPCRRKNITEHHWETFSREVAFDNETRRMLKVFVPVAAVIGLIVFLLSRYNV